MEALGASLRFHRSWKLPGLNPAPHPLPTEPCLSSHPLNRKPAGKVSEELIGGSPGRVAETNFGSYLAGMMVDSVKAIPNFEAKVGPVNIGMLNAGAIRANLEV